MLDHRRIHLGEVNPEELQGAERFIFPALLRFTRKKINPWTTEKDLLEELRLIKQVKQFLAKGERVVVHFMDGEVGFNFFGKYLAFFGRDRERLRLTSTYHQPPSWLQKVLPQKQRTVKLDLLLTVGTSQFSYFDDLPQSKLLFVPHGTDTNFFQPGEFRGVADKLYCITVGQWLRDFDTLEKVIRMAPANMVFRIVAVKESLDRFRDLPNVELYSGIDDESLRRLYQESHIGLMPLQDSTANNGLLEMMASGMPIVITRVGSVEDYITDDCCVMLPDNRPEDLIRILQALELAPEKRKQLGMAARQRGLEFSWSKTADRMAEVYNNTFLADHQA
jgi:glycosyltransferase involved in cell wall biosynthesis